MVLPEGQRLGCKGGCGIRNFWILSGEGRLVETTSKWMEPVGIKASMHVYDTPGRVKGWVQGGLRYSQFWDLGWRGEVSQNCVKLDETFGDENGYMYL